MQVIFEGERKEKADVFPLKIRELNDLDGFELPPGKGSSADFGVKFKCHVAWLRRDGSVIIVEPFPNELDWPCRLRQLRISVDPL